MKQNPIPKVMALVLISIGAACLLLNYDASALSKIDSMPPLDYIQRQRELHQHSYAAHFFTCLVMGGFYLGAIEFLAYIIGLCFPKKATDVSS
ncbi:MAG TPA: hypothetical protein VNU95_11100 [Candidatus Acidoferrales bacterium]|jgi:hypothetical protein|nr:hypothetical protein [Candidatus Acidoferrales bacterium]